MTTFAHFHLHPRLNSNISALGYKEPTPIQRRAIPAVLSGRDVLGLAQTGTGKTAAFGLPLLQGLINGHRRAPRALIVAPTRELAEQIHTDIRSMAAKTGLRGIAVYGGVGKFPQARRLRQGVDIIVACPGRLLDHLGDQAVNLSGIETLVLDEADHMFDMGFLPAIKRIIKALPRERQNLLFSATMPGEIRDLANTILRDPEVIQIDHARPKASVSQLLFPVEPNQKTTLLKNILATTDMEAALIFTRTKHKAKSLARQLQRAGHKAAALHGNLSQSQRRQALQGFKSGRYTLMVATDIAARGIDVSGITHVINYDVPATVEAYTHRIGRTGRAGRSGEAFTFAGRADKKIIRMIERSFGAKLKTVLPAARRGQERHAGQAARLP